MQHKKTWRVPTILSFVIRSLLYSFFVAFGLAFHFYNAGCIQNLEETVQRLNISHERFPDLAHGPSPFGDSERLSLVESHWHQARAQC
jgi:hypothetical protein